jgi:hypothetical protein
MMVLASGREVVPPCIFTSINAVLNSAFEYDLRPYTDIVHLSGKEVLMPNILSAPLYLSYGRVWFMAIKKFLAISVFGCPLYSSAIEEDISRITIKSSTAGSAITILELLR